MRAARALLGWSGQDLAHRARVGITTIRRAEVASGPVRMIPAIVDVISRTFEAAGVEMIPDDGGGIGVRLKGRRG